MANADPTSRGCGCFIATLGLVMGLLLLTVAGTWTVRSYGVQSTWIGVEGTVVDLIPSVDSDTSAPLIEYVGSDGVVRSFEHNVFSNSHRIGESVDVLYDPADPESAVVDSPAGFWIGPALFGAAGLTSLVVASAIGFLGRRRARESSSTGSAESSSRIRKPAEFRRVETKILPDGTFRWKIIARGEDGHEYSGDWFEEDPQMDLMARNYAVALEQKGYDWVVVPL